LLGKLRGNNVVRGSGKHVCLCNILVLVVANVRMNAS
jgi:hypothetical protein